MKPSTNVKNKVSLCFSPKFLSVFVVMMFVLPQILFGKTRQEDEDKRKESKERCLRLKQFHSSIDISCGTNYFHFNPPNSNRYRPSSRDVRIASFNLLHPGSAKSFFKDYHAIARMMDRWDVVAAQELVWSVGRQERHNQKHYQFIESKEVELEQLKDEYHSSPSSNLRKKIKAVAEEIEKSRGSLFVPGFFQLLKELKKLDSSWSLVLAPQGDAARPRQVHEVGGFFYRAKQVKLKRDGYCAKYFGNEDESCLVSFRELLGQDDARFFSRRPFLASFESREFDFALLNSHVIYGSPREEEQMQEYMQRAFKVDHYTDLNAGLNGQTYARYVEAKLTMEWIEAYKERFYEQDLIWLGDFNLEMEDDFFVQLVSKGSYSVFVDEKTSISQQRYLSDESETEGVASNYDHVILDTKESKECLKNTKELRDQRVHNFYSDPISRQVAEPYLIRTLSSRGYRMFEDQEYLIPYNRRSFLEDSENAMTERLSNRFSVVRNELVLNEEAVEKRVENFMDRVFYSQLYDQTFYRFYSELFSDHFPISFECRSYRDDD